LILENWVNNLAEGVSGREIPANIDKLNKDSEYSAGGQEYRVTVEVLLGGMGGSG